MSKSLIKQAEQNVVNRAKAYNDALEFVDALRNFGNAACREYVGKKDFFDGLALVRKAIRAEQSEAIRECFYFAGVGGKEAEAYSKQMFTNAFSGKYEIMHFLHTWGQSPSWYKTEERDALQAEANEIIEKEV